MLPFAHKIHSLIDLPERAVVCSSSPISVMYSKGKALDLGCKERVRGLFYVVTNLVLESLRGL